jgi:hypothetical protein
LIIVSTEENKIIPYQNKINSILNKLINNISPDFNKTNPIISGSYLLNLIVTQNSDFSDYDFYFESISDFNAASKILTANNLEVLFQNSNCISYKSNFDDKPIQLIKSKTGSPEDIILSHDFHNCSIAYQNNKLFFTKKFIQAWSANELDLSSFQEELCETNNHQQIFNSILSTVIRIDKYANRYDLTFSSDTKEKLNKIQTFLIESTNYSNVNKKIVLNSNLFAPYNASPNINLENIDVTKLISMIRSLFYSYVHSSFEDESNNIEFIEPAPVPF